MATRAVTVAGLVSYSPACCVWRGCRRRGYLVYLNPTWEGDPSLADTVGQLESTLGISIELRFDSAPGVVGGPSGSPSTTASEFVADGCIPG